MNANFFANTSCLAYTAAVCEQFEQFYKEANLAENNLATVEKSHIKPHEKTLELTYKLTELLDLSTFRVKRKNSGSTLSLSGKMKQQSQSINGLQFTPSHSWSQEITLPNWIEPARLLATVCAESHTLLISHC